MKVIKLRQGYDINLIGDSSTEISEAPFPKRVAVKPVDFIGVKPKMILDIGEKVKIGTPLAFDKNNEKIKLISPASGKLSEVVRGARRRIEEIVIETDGKQTYENIDISKKEANREQIIETLLKTGLFLSFTQRPFSKRPNPEDIPRDIFISAMDTSPLAADDKIILKENEKYFQKGLEIFSKITSGKAHLSIKKEDKSFFDSFTNCELHAFKGPHPAGNVGVQIHHISPIKNAEDIVWTNTVQAVVLIGKLFLEGTFKPEIIVKVAGSKAPKQQYFKTIAGTEVSNIIGNVGADCRIISGNVLTGRKIENNGFISHCRNLITIIPEAEDAEFLGWLNPGFSKPSWWRTFVSAFLFPKKKFDHDTNIYGGERAFVINTNYEDVTPMRILPSYLIKSILAEDIEAMEGLGIYEVAEEDLALCEYICPSKIEFQQIIRQGLDLMEKEG